MTTFDPHGKLSTSWGRALAPDHDSVSGKAPGAGASGSGEMRTSNGTISVTAASPIPEEVAALGQSLNLAWGQGTAERFAKAVYEAELPADQVRAAAEDVNNVLAGAHFAQEISGARRAVPQSRPTGTP